MTVNLFPIARLRPVTYAPIVQTARGATESIKIMQEPSSHRSSAIRYWEKGRIWYNAALVIPALLGYLSATALSAAAGDRTAFGMFVAGLFFLAAAVAANVCYSFCYALEFLFGGGDASSRWLRYGRTGVFIAGTLLAMMFSLVGGHNIGAFQFTTW